MKIIKLSNNKLLVPLIVKSNKIVGDSMVEVDLDEQDYIFYLREYEKQQKLEEKLDAIL